MKNLKWMHSPIKVTNVITDEIFYCKSVKEAAEKIGTSKDTLYMYVNNGKFYNYEWKLERVETTIEILKEMKNENN